MSMIYKFIKRTFCSCAKRTSEASYRRVLGDYAFDVSDCSDREVDSNGDLLFINHCSIATKHPCNCSRCYHYDYERKPKCKGSIDRWRGFRLLQLPDRDVPISNETRQNVREIIRLICVDVHGGEGSRSGPYVIIRDLILWMRKNGIKRAKLGPVPEDYEKRNEREAAGWIHIAKAYAASKLKIDRLHIEALKEGKKREEEAQCQRNNELLKGKRLLKQSRALVVTLAPRASRKMESQALGSSIA